MHSRHYKVFQEQLRLAREQRQVSQNELARRLRVSQGYISKCESGDLRLDIAQIRAFCEAIGISFLEFMAQYDAAIAADHTSKKRSQHLEIPERK